MDISVIFSTYNSPAWLENVIYGFHCQQDKNFEIVIADDGSSPETKDLISRLKAETKMEIKHVWQEDDGFRKCRILNEAILATRGDYLVFTDGDCIPRSDFVSTHRKYAEEGYYLSGGYFKLPMDISKAITRDDILKERPFNAEWLINRGLVATHKISKLTAQGWKEKLYNSLTPTNRTWNGHNSSGWKKDVLAVNGFNERMQYGGEDCEFGDRLRNMGIKAKQVRYSAICVHLDHSRSYVTEEMREKNKIIRQQTKKDKLIKTDYGIVKVKGLNGRNAHSGQKIPRRATSFSEVIGSLK